MNIPLTPQLAMLTPMTSLVIFIVLLMMFGAKKLPELAKGLGQAIREFTKARNEIHDEILRDPPPQPARQIETPPVQTTTASQPAGTQPAPASQTVSQSSTVPHEHV